MRYLIAAILMITSINTYADHKIGNCYYDALGREHCVDPWDE